MCLSCIAHSFTKEEKNNFSGKGFPPGKPWEIPVLTKEEFKESVGNRKVNIITFDNKIIPLSEKDLEQIYTKALAIITTSVESGVIDIRAIQWENDYEPIFESNSQNKFDKYWNGVKGTDAEPTMWNAMIKLFQWEKFDSEKDFRKRIKPFEFPDSEVDYWMRNFYLVKFPNYN